MLTSSLITLGIVVVGAVGVAWARHGGYCGSGDYFQHVTEWVSQKLDLNEGQNEKLQGVAEALRDLRTDWSGQRTRMAAEVAGLLAAPALDHAKIRGSDSSVSTLHGVCSTSLPSGCPTKCVSALNHPRDHRLQGA